MLVRIYALMAACGRSEVYGVLVVFRRRCVQRRITTMAAGWKRNVAAVCAIGDIREANRKRLRCSVHSGLVRSCIMMRASTVRFFSVRSITAQTCCFQHKFNANVSRGFSCACDSRNDACVYARFKKRDMFAVGSGNASIIER